MKKFFSKENFVFSNLDSKIKTQSWFSTLVVAIAFVFTAFTFMNMLYSFADSVGAITSGSPDVAGKDFIRSLPIFLSFFMSMWSLLLAHAIYRNADEKRYLKSFSKNGIAILVFAGLNILFVIIGRIAGIYSSFVEGNPSPLYPLDSILYSCFFILIGVSALIYKRKANVNFEVPLPSRGPIVRKARFVYCFFVAIWTLIALFSLSDFFLGLFIIDFIHGYFFYSLMFLLVLLLNFVFIGAWELYYNQLVEEKKKELLLPLAICGLIASVLIDVIYFVALGLNLDGPSNVGFGVLPVAFAASVNIAFLLVAFTPIIVSVVALIKGILARKACNKK